MGRKLLLKICIQLMPAPKQTEKNETDKNNIVFKKINVKQ
jgi:hypothetical protein